LPRDVTEDGIISELNDEHSEKQLLPRDVTDDGIMIFVRFSQF
jgi:hypothetical protein